MRASSNNHQYTYLSLTLFVLQSLLLVHESKSLLSSSSLTVFPTFGTFNGQQGQGNSNSVHPFSGNAIPTLAATTEKVSENHSSSRKSKEGMVDSEYSAEELKEALQSMLEDSENPDYDARHIFGYNQPDCHELSMLQIIAATRILDYRQIMAKPESPSRAQLEEAANEFANKHGPILDLREVIRGQSPRMALAAEFKRASPSKGDIATDVNAGEQAVTYASAGANIISVLTESRWFKGTLSDMTDARIQTNNSKKLAIGVVQRPAILRKEFVTEAYQIAEAAAAGGDTVLLIVAVLPQHLLKHLIDYARSLGMEPLVEVHSDSELDVALEAGAKVIGVNNRNLHTFQLDLETSRHAANQLTKRGINFEHNDETAEYSLCALSGMSTAFDVQRYRELGLGMCLIGESLMRAADPAAAIDSLCLHPDDFQKSNPQRRLVSGAYTAGTKLVKVCGTTNSDDALKACQEGVNLIGVIFVPNSKRCVTASDAKEIVQTVRKFGERTSAVKFPRRDNKDSPLTSLVKASRTLEELAQRPLVVGVFQNQSPEFIREMVAECGLDMVQLHGSEGMAAASHDVCGAPVIRVVDIETDSETGKATSSTVETLLESLTSDPVAILLDTSIKGVRGEGGGTGVTFDWSIAERLQNAGLPVIIAGGLTPQNVQDAVASVRPWGVDVSSGLEASPRNKDHIKVEDFVRGTRAAAKEASKGF